MVKAIAWYSSTAGLGASLGLILGGLFASYLTWRIGFYLNVPIALVMLILSLIYLKNKKMPKTKFDWIGTIFSIIGLGSLVYALNGAKNIWLTLGLPMILFGAGEGLALAPLTNMGLYQVSEKNTGVASGLVNVAHQIGGVLGLAIMVNISTALLPNGGTDGQFKIAMYVGLVLAVLVVILAFLTTDEDKDD